MITDSIEAFATSHDQSWRGHVGVGEQTDVEAVSNGPRYAIPCFS